VDPDRIRIPEDKIFNTIKKKKKNEEVHVFPVRLEASFVAFRSFMEGLKEIYCKTVIKNLN
jgi:hypothetical protein